MNVGWRRRVHSDQRRHVIARRTADSERDWDLGIAMVAVLLVPKYHQQRKNWEGLTRDRYASGEASRVVWVVIG